MVTPQSCLKGTYQVVTKGANDLGSCKACPTGTYCNWNEGRADDDDIWDAGRNTPKECKPGQYQNQTGSSSSADCKPCPAGAHVCRHGSHPSVCLLAFLCACTFVCLHVCLSVCVLALLCLASLLPALPLPALPLPALPQPAPHCPALACLALPWLSLPWLPSPCLALHYLALPST